jgi:hypothetical protein
MTQNSENDYVKGRNYKSVRIKRLKNLMRNYNEKMDMPFTKALALLREFLSIGTISFRNCQYARKFIGEKMRPYFQDPQSVIEIDKLETLFEKAEERRERRKAKKSALKTQGAATGTPGKRGRKPKTTAAPAPATPVSSPMALWQEMLDRQKEKDHGTQ